MIKVVVADDEMIIRRGLVKIINENMERFVVVGDFENGENCLDFLVSHNVDLAICDIRMPIMNGIELLKAVRERGLETDFLFVSGYGDFEYCKAAIQGGAIDYMLKPVDKTDFICELKKYEVKFKSPDTEEVADRKIIRDIKQYVQKNIGKKLSVEMMAEKFCLSPNYMSHIFKTETGTSLTQYINGAKMDMACVYLRDHTKRINEIASLLGYNSSQMFTNAFKKVRGLTPSEYRERL